VVEAIWHLFVGREVGRENIRKEVKYAHNADKFGWRVAEKWKKTWEEQLKKLDVLQILANNMSDSNSLRDVLNAAWLCRLDNPDDKSTAAIADAACRLSQTLLELLKKSRERARQRGLLRRGKGKL
jgi:hypothetical protein